MKFSLDSVGMIVSDWSKIACLIDGRGRPGVVLRITQQTLSDGLISQAQPFGEMLDCAKLELYMAVSFEKSVRMFGSEHFSSWQSRMVEEKRYGGSVRSDINPDFGISVSGLSEHLDEALSATVSVYTIGLSPRRWQEIVSCSQNPYMRVYGAIVPA